MNEAANKMIALRSMNLKSCNNLITESGIVNLIGIRIFTYDYYTTEQLVPYR